MATRIHPATTVRIDPDTAIRELAACQHGVVARYQLMEAGVRRYVIQNRLDRGLLVRIFRGVYRVGVVAAEGERAMAAVLACGRGAVLSHRSAAALWSLLPAGPGDEPVHVSALRRAPAPGPEVCVHRVAILTGDEITEHERIPVTSPVRTIVDLAGAVRGGELREAVARAERMKLTSRTALADRLALYRGRRGMGRLRALVTDGGELGLHASNLEKRFHRLMSRARLGPVKTNATLAGWRVDFLWPRHRVVVETDGHAFHADRDQREKDYRKDNDLRDAGYRVVRFTWRQIVREPEAVIATVAHTLGVARAGGDS